MPQYELNIRDYLRIVRKRKWTIIGCFIIVLILTILYTNQQAPIYETFSTVRIEQRATMAGLLSEWFTYSPGDVIATEGKIITSRKVLNEVARQLGLVDENTPQEKFARVVSGLAGMISTERLGNSNIVKIKVSSDNPAKAAVVANATAQVYADLSFQERNRETSEASDFIGEQLESTKKTLRDAEEKLKAFQQTGGVRGTGVLLQSELEKLNAELSTLLDKYTERHPSIIGLKERIQDLRGRLSNLPEEEIELARLQREVQINEESYTLLNKKYKEALINKAQQFRPVTIINPASSPFSPVRPNRPLNTMAGAVIGLLLGFVFASVRENLDTSIGTIEDVEEYLKVPVLGLIPHIALDKHKLKGISREEKKKKQLQANLVLQYDSKSIFAEAYRMFQVNLKLSRLKEKRNVLLFTSATPEEGKTLTAANCGVAAAQAGLKVLLIDADLRKPSIHQLFGIEREPGLTNVLIGNTTLENALKGVSDILIGGLDVDLISKTPGIENLKILSAGFLPPNPVDALGSAQLTSLINKARENFDLILLDSPPALPVADATVIGTKTDGIILVYQTGRIARGALKRMLAQFTSANIPVIGVVLNVIRVGELEMGSPYYYYYYKYYGKERKNWWDNLKRWVRGKRKHSSHT